MVVVPVEVQDHLVVDQLSDAARGLPVKVKPDIGLLHIVVRIVDDQVSAALQSIFDKLLDPGQFFLGKLGDIFGQILASFTEIGIKIGGLVIFPLEILELQAVLSEFNGIYLSDGAAGEEEKP